VHRRPPLQKRTRGSDFEIGFPPIRDFPDGSDRARLRLAIDRAKAGDRDAIRFLYIRHAGAVHRYVLSILHDDYEAEDITQAVFMKLFRTIDRYESREVPFAAWIRRVARNLAVDEIRRRRRAGWGDLDMPDTPADELEPERLRSLVEALRGLPSDQRRVILLRHMCGFAPGEIAEELGKSESSVHGLHHRARGALRRALTDLEASPTTVRVHRECEAAAGQQAA
jgi:RNA polymerase sigma-70 factor (ECF subfamily)